MVVGISMVKDEADVIEATVRHMLGQVDRLLIADNNSTDGTFEFLSDLRDERVELKPDPDPAYYQSFKMSRLAAEASATGAEWVVPFDADECWYSPFGRIADVLAERSEAIAGATLYHHVATAEDPVEGNHIERIGWRRKEPAELPKVAVRPSVPVTIEQGNHGADYHTDRIDGLLVVRHYPYRSPEQMIRKARNGAAAYAATDLPEHTGQHWRDYGRLSDEQISETFRRFYWSANPAADDLLLDPCPSRS